MLQPENIKFYLVDFDGVIAKNSIEISLSYTHDFINKFTPYHINSLKNYYAAINSFDLKEGLSLLFRALGIEDYLPELTDGLNSLKEYNKQPILLDPGYFDFVAFCKSNDIGCSIFSLANSGKIENLLGFKPDLIKPPSSRFSKADPVVYSQICESLYLKPREIIVIDDDPLVLRSAKISGMRTILMGNEFFNNYVPPYQNYIDMMVDSFVEVEKKQELSLLNNL